MDHLKARLAEYDKQVAESYKEYRDQMYIATGRHFIDEIDDLERDTLVREAWHYHELYLETLQQELASDSNLPFVEWLIAKVPRRDIALVIIRNIPIDLKGIDELAANSKWCSDYENVYRPLSVADGMLKEYR